jgi:hypothetical protein
MEMFYRFASAGTKARIAADRARLAAAFPPGALLGAQSYLDTRLRADGDSAPIVPFLMAFGVLGLVMSVIIVSIVVSGAVGTGLRRIGILKAIGFTPGQVVRAYVAQALIPAGAGTALGVVLGNLGLSVAWWVDLAVPSVALGVVVIAALVPALRAGRLRTVEAIAVGRASSTGRGQWAHQAIGRLPLPRAVTLGLADSFRAPGPYGRDAGRRGVRRGRAGDYIARLNTVLLPLSTEAVPNHDSADGLIVVLDAMAGLLTLLLVAVAGLGVLNSVVLDTRERVHDLGVCKAIGMSPRQTMTMVLASVVGLGTAGGITGVPAGVALHDYVLPLMAAGTRLTPHIESVYHALELVLLGLAGIAIAVLGAILPAGWAARARTATALRTE